ncbi:hypothetical protein U0070_019661, partial [Myodes glareolus]
MSGTTGLYQGTNGLTNTTGFGSMHQVDMTLPVLFSLLSLNGPLSSRAGRKCQGASPSIPQPHLQPQELLKRWLDSVCPYHYPYPLGEASVSGDSHHLCLPDQVILPTPVTANTGPPIPLLPHPSFPLSLLSFQPALLALGSWVRFCLWENQMAMVWMVGVYSEEKAWPAKPGISSPNTCLFFFCQDYPSYPGFPQNQYPQYFSPSYNPPYVPASSLCASPLSTSTYVLQEAPHSVPNQTSESLAGDYNTHNGPSTPAKEGDTERPHRASDGKLRGRSKRSSDPSPAGDNEIERVFVWDLDETIIIFHSLLTGTFASRYGKVRIHFVFLFFLKKKKKKEG